MKKALFVTVSSMLASGAVLVGLVGPVSSAGAIQNPGVTCLRVAGSTAGTVTVSSCHDIYQPPPHVPRSGTGVMPGSLFLLGTSTGTIAWTYGSNSFSTTITVATTLAPNPGRGYCARKGLGMTYYSTGHVVSNTNPNIAVGDYVFAQLCITSGGSVQQTHYGGLTT